MLSRKDRYLSKLLYFWVDDVHIKGEFEKTEQEQMEEQTDLGTGTVDRVSLGLRDRRVDSLMLAVQGLGPGADDDSPDACSEASEDEHEHGPEKSKGAKSKQNKPHEDLELEDPHSRPCSITVLKTFFVRVNYFFLQFTSDSLSVSIFDLSSRIRTTSARH